MSQTISVELDAQPIELCKLLKVVNLVAGGGEAKVVISEGYVAVNGEIEYQKRKKIYHHDVVEFNGDFIEVICHQPITEKAPKTKGDKNSVDSQRPVARAKQAKTKASANVKAKAKNRAAKASKAQPEPSGKRKKISF